MIFTQTSLAGLYCIDLERRVDARGWLLRTYDRQLFVEHGLSQDFVQMNHTLTRHRGSLRGLHFQRPPHAEAKLIRCIRGCVFDVVVDIRADSASFLNWQAMELSMTRDRCLYVPPGFAHGFQTLEEECEMLYCHTAAYDPASEAGLRYDDPRLAIPWPLPVTDLSVRDKNHPFLDNKFDGIRL